MLTCNIKVILAQKKMTAREFAKQISVSEKSVSNWVQNISYPTTTKLFEIAHVLDCKTDDLYDYQAD